MVMFYILSALLGVILVIIRYSFWRKQLCQNLPGIEPGFFNIPGDLTTIFLSIISKDRQTVLETFMHLLKERTKVFQHQQLFYVWGFYTPHFFFVKAEAIKQLFSKGKEENEKSWHYDTLHPFVGTGLLTSPLQKWKPRRKLLKPCFHSDILREYLKVFNECSQNLVEYLRQDTKKEFTYIGLPLALTTMDIIYKTMIGATVGALENNRSDFINAMKSFSDMSMARYLKFWEWSDFIHNLTTGRKIKGLIKLIEDFIKSVLQEKKKEYLSRNKDNVKRKRKSFMDLMMELHFETQELSEKDIRDEVNTFVVAGYETVSVTIMWALYLIGLHPDIQEKIHDELDRIFGSDVDRDITEIDLNELKYLDCVLKESQRLYSAVPMVTRTLQKDCNICGYSIPKGSTCIILLYFLHKDEEVFPDPERFDPDRFLPENAVNIPECGFIPFSTGLRNCIGQKFAVMEMKTIVTSILRNYSIESLDSRDKVLPVMKITLNPSIPVRIRIRPKRNIECGGTACL